MRARNLTGLLMYIHLDVTKDDWEYAIQPAEKVFGPISILSTTLAD